MKIVKITGQVELLSGLHIGGGDDTMKIGGIDNSVIKHANGGEPYIPGSSLKGKMRSLLEWHYHLVGLGDGKPFSSKLLNKVLNADDKTNAENLLKLFGDSSESNEFGITRISVGDCNLNQDSKGMELSEAKYENTIDRQKGTAAHPRQSERVPAGVSFDFDIRIKVLEEDSEEELIAMLKQGLKLVENDYLGGSGSRGYGRVQFKLD
ncbi:MAG: type III-A CRISPR-associated RAMP protein Csm3 [Campylobacterota bacterium]|nr:type III-A CRISPR-associated RAMP protein Csm3 [Campylobacterota bacterium]